MFLDIFPDNLATKISVPKLCFVVFPALVLVLHVVKRCYYAIRSPLKSVPGPFLTRFSSIQVTYSSIQGQRAQKLLELHNRYGPIVRVGPNEVSIGDWKYYRAIYSNPKSSAKDPKFYLATSFSSSVNVFQMTNKAQHAARKKLYAAPYSMQSVNLLEPLVREKANVLVDRLINEAESSPAHVADILKICGLFSFEVVCKAGFAKDFHGGDSDDSLSLLRAMEDSTATVPISAAMPWLNWTGLETRIPGHIGRCFRSRDFWVSKSRDMVNEFFANAKEDDKFLFTPLLSGIDEFLGRPLNKHEILEEFIGLMLAGSGTTSSTLTYLVYALSQPENLHVQERLRNDLRDASDDLNSLKRLPFLNAVLKETFRLYPTIISTLPRILEEPLIVESYLLPIGSSVGMQNLVHHRDPKVYLNPELFLPERWLEATEDMEGALTPFGLGRRTCLGQNLAWLELYIGVSRIFKSVEVTLGHFVSKEDMEMKDGFTMSPRCNEVLLEVRKLSS